MKLLACDLCQDVVALRRGPKNKRECSCGNISGYYRPDGRNILVWVRDAGSCRILGIQNSVRAGLKDSGDIWVISFNDQTVTLRKRKK